jgi:hypothetical protein
MQSLLVLVVLVLLMLAETALTEETLPSVLFSPQVAVVALHL